MFVTAMVCSSTPVWRLVTRIQVQYVQVLIIAKKMKAEPI